MVVPSALGQEQEVQRNWGKIRKRKRLTSFHKFQIKTWVLFWSKFGFVPIFIWYELFLQPPYVCLCIHLSIHCILHHSVPTSPFPSHYIHRLEPQTISSSSTKVTGAHSSHCLEWCPLDLWKVYKPQLFWSSSILNASCTEVNDTSRCREMGNEALEMTTLLVEKNCSLSNTASENNGLLCISGGFHFPFVLNKFYPGCSHSHTKAF